MLAGASRCSFSRLFSSVARRNQRTRPFLRNTSSSSSSSSSAPPSSNTATTSAASGATSSSTASSSSTVIKSKKSNTKYYLAGGLLFFGLVCAEDIYNHPDGLLSQSELFPFIADSLNSLLESFNDVLQPSSDELLPEWPTAPCYAALNIPPGTPPPPLLVVDVEKTLIATEHDPRYGYRHVKRKGVDKFIQQLSNYYEVVLFCENDIGMMEHVILAIDNENRTHKLGPSAGEIRNGGDVLKRLDCMNRDERRIILLDDSKTASQLCRRNTILVPPFEDVHDPNKGDDVLLQLIPVLQAMVHDDKLTDFRDVLDDLGGTRRAGGDKGFHQAEQLVEEYQMRITKHRMSEEQKKNRGLGRMLRHVGQSSKSSASDSPTSQLTASPIVSSDGSVKLNVSKKSDEDAAKKPTKKKGGLFEWLDQRENDKAQEAAAKREEMENLYRQKMTQKQEEQQLKQQSGR